MRTAHSCPWRRKWEPPFLTCSQGLKCPLSQYSRMALPIPTLNMRSSWRNTLKKAGSEFKADTQSLPKNQCLKSGACCWMVWFHALSLAGARLQLSYYPERAFCWVGEDRVSWRGGFYSCQSVCSAYQRSNRKALLPEWPFYRWEG